MAVTLAQAALLSQDQLQRGVLEIFVQESPILDRLPLLDIEGNSYAYNQEATLPGVEFRAVNSSYAESTGTVNQQFEKLAILGGDADVDTFIVQTRGNLNDQRAIQTRMKVKASAYKFHAAFFNGDVAVDANSFDGLKKRLTGAQVIDAATNGLPILGSSDADRHAFFDKLDELIAACNPDVLYMNKAVRGAIRSSARRLTMYDETKDAFGRVVATYDGRPLLDAGENPDGSPIIGSTEVQGSASDTSSIYGVRFGEDESDQAVTGLTNGGVSVRDLGEVDDKPAYRTRVEFFCGVGVFGGKAAGRLKGVRK
jgi:hypothetical protein